MKNFDWSSFTREIAIKAPVSVLYDAWTKPVEIEKWFLSQAHFFNADNERISSDSNVLNGHAYKWKWHLYDVIDEGTILEANGTDMVRFTFAGKCPVQINLSQDGEYVMVKLTQSGIPEDDKSKRDIRLGCDSGWSFYLFNLKSVYEGGLDLRNKDTRLKLMMNN